MRLRALIAAATAVIAVQFPDHADAADAYKWSVQYLIDNSRSTKGRPQTVFPRHMRGLAISPDGRFLYGGYHHGHDGGGEIRKIDLRKPDYERATVALLRGPLAKAIAVDDEGSVYVSDATGLFVCDANLAGIDFQIAIGECEGLATTREGSKLILYASMRHDQTLRRWIVQKRGATVTGLLPDGLDEDGEMIIPGAVSPRGIDVDSEGRIWIADLGANLVFRVDRDGKLVEKTEVPTPIDLACDGDRVFVTRWRQREIWILDPAMKVMGSLSIPWTELKLAPIGNNRNGALSGIAAVPGGKGFYVSNERGQTENQKSTYGREDERSGEIDGVRYTDTFMDDNEPVLHAIPVDSSEAGS